MANIGDKFIITIGDKMINEQSGETLYRVKGFKSLVFDDKGIEKLTPYEGNTNCYPIVVGSIVSYKNIWRGVVIDSNDMWERAIVLNEDGDIVSALKSDLYASGERLNGMEFVMTNMLSALKDRIKDWGEANERKEM